MVIIVSKVWIFQKGSNILNNFDIWCDLSTNYRNSNKNLFFSKSLLDFYIEPPINVEYDPNTYTIVFDTPASSDLYCAKIEINDGRRWIVYDPCVPTVGGQVKLPRNTIIEALRVSMCLKTRQDVCSDPNSARMCQYLCSLFYLFNVVLVILDFLDFM